MFLSRKYLLRCSVKKTHYISEQYPTVSSETFEVWGDYETLTQKRLHKDHLATANKLNRYLERSSVTKAAFVDEEWTLSRQDYVVILAITVDVLNVGFKLFAWSRTHSYSLLAEAIHSCADTFNQTILLIGILRSHKKASVRHPYGYYNVTYVVALISGVGIFCLGASMSVYLGGKSLLLSDSAPGYPVEDLAWALWTLLFGLISESTAFSFSLGAAVLGARRNGTTLARYVFRAQEPGINVVLLEDSVAVAGIVVAAAMLGISWAYQSPVPDAIGSIVIGCLLAVVSVLLIYTSSTALVGRSVPQESLEEMNRTLEADVMIRAIYDVKGIEMGNSKVRYKAEIDFDGAKLTRLYLDQINPDALLQEMQSIQTTEQMEQFMVKHGERIVDLLGSEIDRIEKRMRKHFKNIRHLDLEIL